MIVASTIKATTTTHAFLQIYPSDAKASWVWYSRFYSHIWFSRVWSLDQYVRALLCVDLEMCWQRITYPSFWSLYVDLITLVFLPFDSYNKLSETKAVACYSVLQPVSNIATSEQKQSRLATKTRLTCTEPQNDNKSLHTKHQIPQRVCFEYELYLLVGSKIFIAHKDSASYSMNSSLFPLLMKWRHDTQTHSGVSSRAHPLFPCPWYQTQLSASYCFRVFDLRCVRASALTLFVLTFSNNKSICCGEARVTQVRSVFSTDKHESLDDTFSKHVSAHLFQTKLKIQLDFLELARNNSRHLISAQPGVRPNKFFHANLIRIKDDSRLWKRIWCADRQVRVDCWPEMVFDRINQHSAKIKHLKLAPTIWSFYDYHWWLKIDHHKQNHF